MNTKKKWYRVFLIITFVSFSASLIIPFISVTSILAPIAMITLIPCNIIMIILRAEIDFDEEQELIYELEEQIKQEEQKLMELELYVKGTMPKNCWECPCFKNDIEQCCGLDNGFNDYFLDEIDGGICPLKSLEEHDKNLKEKILSDINKKEESK